MKTQTGLKKLLLCVAAVILTVRAQADAPPTPGRAPGAIVGVVRNSEKVPVSGAMVTAVRSDGGAIRATLSGNDGIYSFADLPPGTWTLTLQLDGYPEVQVPALQVVTSKATRYDVVMSVPSLAAAPKYAAPAPIIAAPPPTATAAPPAVAAVTVPEALQSPEPGPEVDTKTPWAQVGYVGWMNGTSREKAPVFDTKFFTPEIRLDMNYLQSLNHPIDHTIVGSTEEFRSGEFQIEQVSLGGDFHWDNVRARFLSMFGMFATTTVVLPDKPAVVTVPETAVDYTLYGDSVYLITEKKAEDGSTGLTAVRTFVRTGNRVHGRAEIVSGLKPGDRVVAVGQLKLQSGAAVVISTDPAPPIPANPPRY